MEEEDVPRRLVIVEEKRYAQTPSCPFSWPPAPDARVHAHAPQFVDPAAHRLGAAAHPLETEVRAELGRVRQLVEPAEAELVLASRRELEDAWAGGRGLGGSRGDGPIAAPLPSACTPASGLCQRDGARRACRGAADPRTKGALAFHDVARN